jgi:hypothetical protein
MEDQRIILPPRATSFRAVCSACQAGQPPSRGYLGAIVEGMLSLDDDRGSIVCQRGHEIELVRETPAAALR